MKKCIGICLLLALLLTAVGATTGTAEGSFELEDKGTLTSYSGDAAEVAIPAEINGEAVRALGDTLFYRHGEITKLTIPEGVISIDAGATADMTGLREITLPESLCEIQAENFYDCDALETITLPANLIYLGARCFRYCDVLREIIFTGPVPVIGVECFDYLPGNAVIRVPEDLLEEYRSVIPEGLAVESSGRAAVVPEVVVPGDEEFDFEAGPGILYGYYGSAPRIEIPASIGGVPVTAIGERAFRYSQYLAEVRLPEGVTEIGKQAFRGANRLVRLVCPETLTTIGEGAFMYALASDTFDWPAGLTTIESDAFYGSSLDGTLELPGTVSRIGSEAFKNITVDTLILHSVPEIGDSAFDDYMLKRVELPWGCSAEDAAELTACFNGMTPDAEIVAGAEPTLSLTPDPRPIPIPTPKRTPAPSPMSELTSTPAPERTPTPEPTAAPTPEPTSAPTPESAADPGSIGLTADVKYVTVSILITSTGKEMPPESMPEYAVTFHTDGTADFVMSGVPISGLSWTAEGNTGKLDYFGQTITFIPEDGGVTMDFFGSMHMKMMPEN